MNKLTGLKYLCMALAAGYLVTGGPTNAASKVSVGISDPSLIMKVDYCNQYTGGSPPVACNKDSKGKCEECVGKDSGKLKHMICTEVPGTPPTYKWDGPTAGGCPKATGTDTGAVSADGIAID
jgi:hypothetical protein